MPRGIQPSTKLQTPPEGFLGLDTASEPTSISLARSRRLNNAYQGRLRALTQRPGSVPVIETALSDPITHLTTYPFSQTVAVGAAPSLSATGSGATLPAATYYCRYTYVTAGGETESSAEASQAITLGEVLRVTVPALPPYAESINIYISTTTNTEKLERNVTALVIDFDEPLDGTGSAYPTANTTAFSGALLAVSGTSMYAYYDDALNSLTMTNALNSDRVYDADFTGINSGTLVNIKVIADGGILKQCNGSEVEDVTPATDDGSPAPDNVLTDINALGIKFVWEHSQHIFVTPGDNQMWYSKRAGAGGNGMQYDYFPETSYLLAVRKGDFINGPGIPFDDVCLIPMRKGWNVLKGTNFNDFDSGEFLNTINGLIASRSAQIITYANGQQTIAFLSDDGVHEVFTTVLDNRGKQYATRGLMKEKIDFEAIGFTESEKTAAISKYIVSLNMYLLEITRDTTTYVFGYDTRNAEWYVWTGLQINSLIEQDSVIYFAGDDGLLKVFDRALNSDWDDVAKTTGTPIDFDRISGMLWFEDTGYPSTLDYYILRLKQYAVAASLDISLVYMSGLVDVQEAIQNAYLIWDESEWDESVWANLDYTDLVSAPQRLSTRLRLPKQAYYFQVRWRNNRDEPVEIYGETLIGRASGEL